MINAPKGCVMRRNDVNYNTTLSCNLRIKILNMASPIPYDVRVKIIERMRSTGSIKELANEFGYSVSGVRKIWKHYQLKGESAYHTNYSNCGSRSIYGQEVRGLVKKIRDNKQGANYVSSKLLIKYPKILSPSPRTLQRWWVKEESNRSQGRIPDDEKKRGVTKFITLGK